VNNARPEGRVSFLALIGPPSCARPYQSPYDDPSRDIDRLLAIMAALRTPKTGCPWDLEQNFATIAPYTLEEAYEVADAIARDDLTDLKEDWAISSSRWFPRPHG